VAAAVVVAAVRVRHNCHRAGGRHLAARNVPEAAVEIVRPSEAAHRNCPQQIVPVRAPETDPPRSPVARVVRIGRGRASQIVPEPAREIVHRNSHRTDPAQALVERIDPVQDPASAPAKATSEIFSASRAEPPRVAPLAVRSQAAWEIVHRNSPPIGLASVIARGLGNDLADPNSARTGVNARKTETTSGSSV
jgi:hypothetical protein